MLRLRIVTAALCGLSLAASACSTAASPSATGAASAEGSGMVGSVNITLQEFSVIADPATAPAGEVTFHITNNGPEDVHEFVVIKTDLAPEALPTTDDGSVDEEGEGVAVVDEVEDIPVGETEDLPVTLEPGAYVLICNIVEDDEVHYQMGMRTAFTVE